MNGLAILIVTATLGVEMGVQATQNGDFEYIVRVEPELLEAFAAGEPIINEIPDELRGGGRLRIVVGNQPLPPLRKPVISFPAGGPLSDDAPKSPPPFLQPPPTNPNTFPPLAPLTDSTIPPNGHLRPNGNLPPGGNNGEGEFKPFIPPPLPNPRDLKVLEGLGNDAVRDRAFDPPIDNLKPGGNDFSPSGPSGKVPPSQPPIPDPDPQTRRQVDPFSHPVQVATQPLRPLDTDEPPRFQKTSFSEDAKIADAKNQQSTEAGQKEKSGITDTGTEADRPWTPLAITSLLLFGSVGLNAYLGWISRVFYRRYRQLTRQMRDDRRISVPEPMEISRSIDESDFDDE